MLRRSLQAFWCVGLWLITHDPSIAFAPDHSLNGRSHTAEHGAGCAANAGSTIWWSAGQKLSDGSSPCKSGCYHHQRSGDVACFFDGRGSLTIRHSRDLYICPPKLNASLFRISSRGDAL